MTTLQTYAIKCDDCKQTIGYTADLHTSAAGGRCDNCRAIASLPNIVKVTRLRDAMWAKCKDCDYVMTPSLYWGLSKSMWLHTSGTGHKRWTLYAVEAVGPGRH